MQFFAERQNFLKLGPEILYLGVFGYNFEKTIIIFEISALEFVQWQYFFQK